MLKILRSPIHLNKLGLKKKKGKKGESSEELVDLVTGQTFPVVNDVPDFLSLDQEKSGKDLPASYKSSQDIRSRWKSRLFTYIEWIRSCDSKNFCRSFRDSSK